MDENCRLFIVSQNNVANAPVWPESKIKEVESYVAAKLRRLFNCEVSVIAFSSEIELIEVTPQVKEFE